MKSIAIFLLFLACFASCTNKKKEPVLGGLWTLNVMEVKDTNGVWKLYKDGMQGLLLYSNDGYVSLHLTTKSYNKTHLNFPNFKDTISLKALKHLTNNYNYTGLYDINKDVVRHIKLSHSNPNEWGDTAFRRFWFRGDTLMMSPVETKNANLRLKWLRFN